MTFLFCSVYLSFSKWIARVGNFINRAATLKSKFYDIFPVLRMEAEKID